jgi:alpha-L-fucosidase
LHGLGGIPRTEKNECATINRRNFLGTALATMSAAPWRGANARATTAPFRPTWESLSHYQAPDWFRDAKFGIWAHWSAQCVPEQGDWYARLMYQQGEPAYEHHVKTYGHPSRSGFMEIDHLWKAESWEPGKLMELYRSAGAKYFMALANHHDNFDAYDSAHHAWNSVGIGPKKDIVGTWAKVTRNAGLRFAVSNHSAHAWHWFQTAYGYDGEGALAGVRYDAAVLTRADGRGKWWDGLDPQELYTGPNFKMPDGLRSIAAVNRWHEENDRVWTEAPPPHNPDFIRHWSLRCRDLIEKYRPDMVYFDDSGLPLGQAGLDIAAWYYNINQSWHDGRLEAVITGKELKPEQRHALVEDMERGFSDQIRPLPWQTDTCIGNWHYDRALFERHGYKSAASVITRLCDIVSKNGNLMLSVPMRGNGTIDSDEVAILEALAAWMRVNGEAIFGTRPWKVFGEGPTQVKAGMFGENNATPFTADDIRFTTRQGDLYAITLGRPTAPTLTLRSLAGVGADQVQHVRLLGMETGLRFRQESQGLILSLPDSLPGDTAYAFKISGRGLT